MRLALPMRACEGFAFTIHRVETAFNESLSSE